MTPRSAALSVYAQWLRRTVLTGPLPEHVALIMDGNRRWARLNGHANPSVGHRYGASADNLANRPPDEVTFLMHVAEDVIASRLARTAGGWQLHLAGNLDLLPSSTASALKEAREATSARGSQGHLTVAIGYDGRSEIVEAVRSILDEAAAADTAWETVAASITAETIAAHLYNPRLPNPDLIIRTSGEQRLSDFMLWQSVDSELYFCDIY